MLVPMILEFSDKIKIENVPKKIMVFCHKFVERICFMIVISYTYDRVASYQSTIWKNCKSFILFGRFNLEECEVCKALIKGSHNLLVYIKVTKSVKGPSRLIITKKLLHKFSK
jgi:hypothetical protein